MPKRLKTMVFVLVAGAVATALWLRLARPEQIEIARPVKRDVVELVVASGYVRAGRQADLGVELAGIADAVLVKEGDSVFAGQTLVSLRSTELDDRAVQLRASLTRAQRELDLARRPAYPEDLATARNELAAARRVNQALVDAARSRLKRAESGGREQEVAISQASLVKTRASTQLAQQELDRAESLYRQGAIPLSQVQRERTAFEHAQAQEAAAQQQLELSDRPVREEDIAAARSELRAAEARLETQVKAAQVNLQNLLNQPRSEPVSVAVERVKEARTALQQAENARSKTSVKAPFAGVVTRRAVEPGQSVVPGQPIIGLADMTAAEIRLMTDESNLPRLRQGQPAVVFIPSSPGRKFNARLVRIGPGVDRNKGVVELRLAIEPGAGTLLPDQTVDVNIQTATMKGTMAVPASSVLRSEGRDYALVLDEGTLRRKDIRVTARSEEWVAVDGLSEDDTVALNASRVKAGQRVTASEGKGSVR